jgi:DNA-binding response OmpR family regulator
MSDDKNKALNSGCDDYISKPIKKDILIEKIRFFIEIEKTNL